MAWVWIWFGVILGSLTATWPCSLAVIAGNTVALILCKLRLRQFFLIGLALGFVRMSCFWFMPLTSISHDFEMGKEGEFEFVAEQRVSFGTLVSLKKIDGALSSTNEWARINQELDEGAQYRAVGKIFPLSGYEKDFGLQNERIWHEENLVGRLKLTSPLTAVSYSPNLRIRLRNIVFRWLETPYPELTGFKRALVLGDTSGISPDIWKAMNYLGLSHLLVVSGLHLSFLILVLTILSRKILVHGGQKRHGAARILIVLIISIFFFACNRDQSLQRALMVFLIVHVAGYFIPAIHRYAPVERLAIVGIILALSKPIELLQPSYSFSFGATFAILQSREWSERGRRFWFVCYPYFFIAPIGAAFGLLIHPLSAFFNFFVMPVYGLIVIPLCLGSAFLPFGNQMGRFTLHFFITAMEKLSTLLAEWTPTFHLPFSVATFILMLSVILFQFREMSWRLRMLALLLVQVLWLSTSFLYPGRHIKSHEIELLALDVGQGDAFLLQMEDKRIVIDGGGPGLGQRVLFPSVLREFSNRVDLWVLTHFDQDHRANFQEISSWLQVRELWIPRLDNSETAFSIQAAERPFQQVADHPQSLCSKNFCLETWSWKHFSPADERVGNEDCVVVLLFTRRALDHDRHLIGVFLGDLPAGGEVALVHELIDKHVEISEKQVLFLKAGHHGSRTSSSIELLNYLRPQYFIISCGRNNRFHFPDQSVLDRAENFGTKVLRTDAIGSLKLHFKI